MRDMFVETRYVSLHDNCSRPSTGSMLDGCLLKCTPGSVGVKQVIFASRQEPVGVGVLIAKWLKRFRNRYSQSVEVNIPERMNFRHHTKPGRAGGSNESLAVDPHAFEPTLIFLCWAALEFRVEAEGD